MAETEHDTEHDYAPGTGPATKVSVSLPAGSIQAIRRHVGPREFSAYVAAAIERQIERDLLEEALERAEAACGPIPEEINDEAVEFFRRLIAKPTPPEDAE
jgi:hypothetical protein